MESYVVVGGGLAGLTAANALAGRGRKVTVFEQSEHLGGTAITQCKSGYSLNLGAHALYRGSRAMRIFRQWNIPFTGGSPNPGGAAYFVHEGRKFPFFRNLKGLLQTRLLGFGEKLQMARVFTALLKDEPPADQTMEQWLACRARSRRVRRLAAAITRLSAYTGDLGRLSARAALTQIRMGRTDGVLYLDGGWQTLVDGLARRALSLGVEFRGGRPVESLEPFGASRVILAVPPASVERITGVALPGLWPGRVAALDLGLSSLPEKSASFALGVDRPIFLTVPTAVAKLAPEGAAVVHLVKYLGAGQTSPEADRAELEVFADIAIRGWRERAEVVRFLPQLTVSDALPTVEGRPGVDALGLPGVALAGNWVGPEEMLSGAAVASAIEAASAILQPELQAA